MQRQDATPRDDGDLIDRIYEAAAVPEFWPGVLDALAAHADCRAAVLISTDGTEVANWIGNPTIVEAMDIYVRDGWGARNPLSDRAIARSLPDFIGEFDVFHQREIDESPFYQEFMRPNGLAWSGGTVISGPTDTHVTVSVHRPHVMGPVERVHLDRLTQLRPHLARAAFLAARLRLEQARAAVQALAAIGLPAAALSVEGRLKVANDLFQALIPEVALDRRERLKFADREADKLFNQGLEALRLGVAGLTFPVPASAEATPMVVHLVPIAGAAHDIFSATRWLLVCAPVAKANRIDSGVLQGLFDLTAAEARVAKGLAAGDTLDSLAARHGLGRETIRSQLKAVMAKTGTHRQADLVRLLTGTASLRR
ncbi:helix-turn-helix transcriptional regulator [Phreatobacter stygius]|uniref:Helix-turn-helix transcriptional regulator n=1 Tax=Phreatobacter stygius TaxID=1940610 RepID=A0A4D7B0M2_9HYPH|nr:helix-turn-helix transcriptional regulator [Phreatobacter stygius]QCI67209.1 helix-turn-helix transcriptional regulator [Phreatobacter stygius]